jgi:hypothetical protein
MHACPMKYWVVTTRNGNYSAFNGYHFTPSNYSQLHCFRCGVYWRSSGRYVIKIPDTDKETENLARELRNKNNGKQDIINNLEL